MSEETNTASIKQNSKRAYCNKCQRPQKACICKFTSDVFNTINVLVLQHPTEVKQTKGTVTLLASSLSNIQVEVGEDFSTNDAVEAFVKHHSPCYLLYPSEQATVLQHEENGAFLEDKPKGLIVIDGTWKKAYRIYQLSKNLQQMPSMVLPENIECFYQIRKTKKKQALSSYEACVHALALLEQDQAKYQIMIDNFIAFNQFQLSFTPKHHQPNGISE